MLTDKEKTELKSLDAKAKHDAHAEQCQRIHRAVNDGTLDRATVNDALERLEAMAGDDLAEPAKPEVFIPPTKPAMPGDAQKPTV